MTLSVSCWVFGVVLASAEPVLVPEVCCAAGVLGLPLLTLFLHSHLYLRIILLQLVIKLPGARKKIWWEMKFLKTCILELTLFYLDILIFLL